MGDKITSAGWLIELMRCDHLDTATYAANLIAPQGGSSNDPTKNWVNGPVAVCSGDEALQALGDLLQPWAWTITAWKVFGSSDGGVTWAELATVSGASGVAPVDPAVSKVIRAALAEELQIRTTGCRDAFSFSDPRWVGHPQDNGSGRVIEQSWPHAVVSLTHTPAGLSNDVLHFGQFFRLEVAAPPLVVAFPVFTLGAQTFTPQAPTVVTSAFVAAGYDQTFGGIPVVFAMPPTPTAPNDLAAQTTAPLTEGLKAREVIDDLFVAHLLPATTLGAVLADMNFKLATSNPDAGLIFKTPFPQAKWLLALLRSVGSGWFRVRKRGIGLARPHVLQFSASQECLDELVAAYCSSLTQPIGEALEQAFGEPAEQDATALLSALGKQLPSGTLWQAVTDLLTPVADLPQTPSDDDYQVRLKASKAFFNAWNTMACAIAGDYRGLAMAASIRGRISVQRAQASGVKRQALDAILSSLPNKFDSQTAAQLALGALDASATPSALWTPLSAFVEARGDTQQEDTFLRTIMQEITADATSLVPDQVLLPQFKTELAIVRDEFRRDFTSRTSNEAHRALDEGLRLEFDAMAYGGASVDHLIRGFAVALCGSISSATTTEPEFIDTKRARWITHTAVRYYPQGGGSDLIKTGGAATWYSSAVGSAVVGAKRVGQATYIDKPLCATLEDIQGNAVDAPIFAVVNSFEQRWPTAASDGSVWATLPLLAYGAEYRGNVTALDNAGGIVQVALRDLTYITSAADPKSLPWNQQTPFARYESRVSAGIPQVKLLVTSLGQTRPSSVEATELTGETRALRFVSQQLELRKKNNTVTELAVRVALPQVFALAPRSGKDPAKPQLLDWYLPDRPAQLRLEIRPPCSSVGFIRSWLATDQLILDSTFTTNEKSRALSDRAFVDHPGAFSAFRDLVCASSSVTPDSNVDNSGYNPIVSALGIEFFYGDTLEQMDPIEIARTNWDAANGRLQPARPVEQLTIFADASVAAPKVSIINNQVTLILPAGRFVRVRIYSLVEESYFVATDAQGKPLRTNSRMRFASFLGEPQTGKWKDYRRFGPAEYWIESLPDWTAPQTPDYFTLRIPTPDATHPEVVPLMLSTLLHAEWIRAVEINRHSWHWTGYPVQFPPLAAATELQRWLPAFAGVESKREKKQVVLSTYVDPNVGWLYGDQQYPQSLVTGTVMLDAQRLEAGDRPSRYTAYTARPIVRFRAWLKGATDSGPRKLERDIFAAGNLIPGVTGYSETKRLPTPAFRYRIPLTATYQYDPTQSSALKLSRTNNGNLLIFQDAIRRTDSFSRVGGIGDLLEIDLLQTRTFAIPGAQERPFWEIGPNPIFHKSPAAGLPPDQIQTLRQLTVEASAPHGLTYDLVPNAKVAQTAVLVRAAARTHEPGADPGEGDAALRQWILAKLRARRVILPELQLSAALVPITDIHDSYRLPWRREGLDRIPADFAVDFAPGLVPMQVNLTCDGKPYPLSIPSLPAASKVRLLVSFHKDRWDPNQPPGPPTGVPYWAPQVMVQQPRGDATSGEELLGWDTFATETCHGKPPWLPKDGMLALNILGANVSNAFAAQLSDYSDPRWVLFIGTIPGTKAQGPDQYAFGVQKDALGKVKKLVVTQGSFAPLPRPPQRPEDWSGDQVEFYVLLVSAPPTNIMTGISGINDVGLLAFQSSLDDQKKPVANEFIPLGHIDLSADSLVGASALLCAFQRISSSSKSERSVPIDSLDSLVRCIFPDPLPDGSGQVLESLVRPTGNHWGPMVIGDVLNQQS